MAGRYRLLYATFKYSITVNQSRQNAASPRDFCRVYSIICRKIYGELSRRLTTDLSVCHVHTIICGAGK